MGADFYFNPPTDKPKTLSEQVAQIEKDRKDLIASNLKLQAILKEAAENAAMWQAKYTGLLADLKALKEE